MFIIIILDLRQNTLTIFLMLEPIKANLYNKQINARALIGQSAVGYCAGKPTEKSRVF